MSVKRTLAGTLAALLLAACSRSPSAPSEPRVEIQRAATNTTPGDSTQATERGHTFGSGT